MPRKEHKRNVDVALHFQVSKQFLSYILIGMAETCPEMLSWFGDHNTDIVRIEDDKDDKTWLDPLSVIRIVGRYDRKEDEEGSRKGRATLDFAAVIMGLQRVGSADIYPALKGRILSAMANDDSGDIDSEACDVIAQLAIFSEVVYG